MSKIKRIYVRRYRDNGQVCAYVEWADGSRTEGAAFKHCRRSPLPYLASFGPHMHALFARAKREGLTLEKETW